MVTRIEPPPPPPGTLLISSLVWRLAVSHIGCFHLLSPANASLCWGSPMSSSHLITHWWSMWSTGLGLGLSWDLMANINFFLCRWFFMPSSFSKWWGPAETREAPVALDDKDPTYWPRPSRSSHDATIRRSHCWKGTETDTEFDKRTQSQIQLQHV